MTLLSLAGSVPAGHITGKLRPNQLPAIFSYGGGVLSFTVALTVSGLLTASAGIQIPNGQVLLVGTDPGGTGDIRLRSSSTGINFEGDTRIMRRAGAGIKLRNNADTVDLDFQAGPGHFSGIVNTTEYYQVDGTKVVSNQGAAVADATDAATAITQLNAWLARARAHGLIAT